MFLRSHYIIFVQFIVSVRINVSSCFSGHTVLSSLSLLLVFALTSSNVYRSGCIIFVQFIVSVRIDVFSSFLRSHCIIFVQFIVIVPINVF